MTDTDLVTRLRDFVDDGVASPVPLMEEAATEIERLTQALDDECMAHQVCVEMRDIANGELKRLNIALRGRE